MAILLFYAFERSKLNIQAQDSCSKPHFLFPCISKILFHFWIGLLRMTTHLYIVQTMGTCY